MLLEQIVNGLVSGGLYALIALGFTLVFGVLDKLNFAHSEVFMFGGYAGMVALAGGGGLAAAVVMVVVVTMLMGLAIELISFRKFRSDDAQATAALSSMLVGLVIVELTQRVWGADGKALNIAPEVYTAGTRIFGVQIAYVKLVILALALVIMGGLLFVVERTRLGREIRAISESADAARLMGVDVTRVTQATFAIASALAGLSGLMLACKTGVAISDVGLSFGLKAMAIMAIGGMGDLRGAMAAGLLVGLAEGLTYEFGFGRLSEMTVWILMMLVLLVRPAGLFGGGGERSVRA